jgi:hypothetical protein
MNVLEIIKMNVKSYRLVTCFMEPDGDILFCNYPQDMHVDLDIAKELVQNRFEFTKDKKHYLVLHFSSIREITYDAIQYLKAPEGVKNILGAAYIVNDKVSIEIADIFVNASKKFPAKLFASETEATIWINQLREYHTAIKPKNKLS